MSAKGTYIDKNYIKWYNKSVKMFLVQIPNWVMSEAMTLVKGFIKKQK